MSALPLPDLAQCASEPIRVPGAIQPHGRMVVLSAADGALLAFSANWAGADEAREAVNALPIAGGALADGAGPSWVGTLQLHGRAWDVTAHRQGAQLLAEYEPGAAPAGMHAPIYQVARELLPQLQQAASVDQLCQRVARDMKRLTGFGRCLVYRFDSDGHGEVLHRRVNRLRVLLHIHTQPQIRDSQTEEGRQHGAMGVIICSIDVCNVIDLRDIMSADEVPEAFS
jgi:light-regulated signal transduction histidine kinase (bacteriophytochrome)